MDGQQGLRSLSRTSGSWMQEHFRSPGGRILGAPTGETVATVEPLQPGQADAALVAAAPRMLELLLRWIRAGDVYPEELQRNTRELVTELEPASARGLLMALLHHAGSLDDVASRPTADEGEA